MDDGNERSIDVSMLTLGAVMALAEVDSDGKDR